VSSWSPLIIAVVVLAAAIAIMAPIVGTAIALALLVALRAVAGTAKRLARRRASDGLRSGDLVVALAFYPLALLRSAAGLLLLAPVAVLGFCVVVAFAIIAIPVQPLPQAVALGAGAMVLIVGLGPGSSGGRGVLAGMFGSIGRTRSRMTVAYIGVLALALWLGVEAWAQSQSPAYWPFTNLHSQLVHLPTIRTMLTDVRQSVLKIAHQIGL